MPRNRHYASRRVRSEATPRPAEWIRELSAPRGPLSAWRPALSISHIMTCSSHYISTTKNLNVCRYYTIIERDHIFFHCESRKRWSSIWVDIQHLWTFVGSMCNSCAATFDNVINSLILVKTMWKIRHFHLFLLSVAN